VEKLNSGGFENMTELVLPDKKLSQFMISDVLRSVLARKSDGKPVKSQR
jgi:hypothetical protein